MLKITTMKETAAPLRVHLYGRFTGEYVPEVEQALAEQGTETLNVVLDLSHVTFVDRAGMMFLCGVKSSSVAVENIPSYVKRWIEQENRCGAAGK